MQKSQRIIVIEASLVVKVGLEHTVAKEFVLSKPHETAFSV